MDVCSPSTDVVGEERTKHSWTISCSTRRLLTVTVTCVVYWNV